MKNIKNKTLAFFVLWQCFYCFAQEPIKTRQAVNESSGFLYGIGLSSNKEIYKGDDSRTMLLPLIGYKGDNFSVFGPYISYHLKKINDFKASITLAPRFQGFDQSDSYIFKGLKERKNSLDAGADLGYQIKDWRIKLSMMFDVLNRSNGFEIKSSVGRKYRFGPVFIEPTVSVSYLDSHHVDYYYGVSINEISQLRSVYAGNEAKNISIGLSIATPIFLGGYTRMYIEHTWFDSNISNSPLVEQGTSLSAQLFFTKYF